MVLRSKVEVASRLQCGSYARLVPASCPGAGTGAPGWGDDAAHPGARVPEVPLGIDGARQAAAF
jgi:hypothetical protein